jgi:hypothetical protein
LSLKPLSCLAADFAASFEIAQTQGKVSTKATSTTDQATLSFATTSLELGVDYFHLPALAFYSQVTLPIQSDIDANMTGIDLGSRFYFGGLGRKTHVQAEDVQVKALPTSGSFVFVGLSSRNLSLSDRTLNFLGAEAGFGYDHHLSSLLALRFSLGGQYLQNASIRTMNTVTAAIGMIYQF